ncbi:N-acetyltransferase 9 protein [Elysia marginata]|uniref:N-acetyltransferase 9 protein n=1 Tax=Elysia marginata TaxID=1093978 RepID=A0AAV4JEH5_9GAST|nr:N-acetyltransferase 9 protein [Elysia marginata]
MRYAKENLGTKSFSSKIGFSNNASLNLFQSLGFKEVSRSEVFEEVTLQLEESATDVVLKFTENYALESSVES